MTNTRADGKSDAPSPPNASLIAVAVRLLASPMAVALIAGLVLAGIVVWRGWIADDAFISFHYSRNIVHGYGPVFNPGEHVQAFTHPLWLMLITLAYAVWPEPIWVAVTLGAVLTLATFLVIGNGLVSRGSNPANAAALLIVIAALFVSSEAWRSFQSSGLENSLSGLLVALIVVEVFRGSWRAGRLSLLASLLVLTRPDFVFLVAPLGLAALVLRRPGDLPRLVLGTLPLLAWLTFSFVYYGELVPNTATAKVGVFTISQGIDAGSAYVVDWLRFEWLPAAGCVLLLVAALIRCRRPLPLILLAGGALYLAYVVYIGGDFMRGRMLLTSFETFSLVGAFALAEAKWRLSNLAWAACASAIGLAVIFQFVRPSFNNQISSKGIVWEREFYWGFQVQHLSYNHGKVSGGWVDGSIFRDQTSFETLHEYVDVCGPVTIHASTIGFVSYETGPGVKVIDLYGLADKTIARLPRSSLLTKPPRTGHPGKFIPIGYLASRGDVAILENWWAGIEAKDCSLTERTKAHSEDSGSFNFLVPNLSHLK